MDADERRLNRTIAAIEQGIEHKLHLGAQLFVAHDGEVVADVAIGQATPDRPLRRDDLILWMSSTKPIVAVAVAQLVDKGKLGFNDLVAQHIPEFGHRGKEGVTLRHVLTHTGGFRNAAINRTAESWGQIIAKICESSIEHDWLPGQRAGYHLASGWYILAELVRRVDGRVFEQYVRDELFVPLEMNDSWIGMPDDQYARYGDRIVPAYATEKGALDERGFFNSEAGVVLCRPGANGRGPARELGRFYQAMLDLRRCQPRSRGELIEENPEQDLIQTWAAPGRTIPPDPPPEKRFGAGATMLAKCPPVLSSQLAEQLTIRQRIGMYDETFKHSIDWGLGFIINSARYGADTVPYGYGRHASEETFGHSGNQSSCAFADPAHNLVVVWVCNGMPGESKHDQRLRAINSAIYEDLKLA
jgi:CubicO group peptidase (beta-lactamase class C family)